LIAALVVGWRRYPSQPWPRVIAETATAAIVYSTGAHLFLMKLPAPVPTRTPFDQDVADRESYLAGFAEGYRDGVVGMFRTYCFRPEAETTGSENGADCGCRTWYRFWGLPFPKRLALAMEQRGQASPPFGLYWELTSPPKLDTPDAMASVAAFVATNGWHMQTNEALWFHQAELAKPISGLPWPELQTNRLEAATRDGILYVRLHTWAGETSGVAYNPQTNRFPPSVVGFKPLGGHWYTWLEVTGLRRYPQYYEGETPPRDWRERYGFGPDLKSSR